MAALRELHPTLIVPAALHRLEGHACTGWKATHALARELPGAFIANSVGTRFAM